VEKLVQEGNIVLTVDLRGFGETSPKPPKGYFGSGYHNPFLAIHVNRPLLGQRVEDALAALDVLSRRPDVDAGKLSIVGVERGGPIALHAAALDERIGAVTIESAIESWMDVVATPLGKDQLTQVVPGALAVYDLPDLVRSISPRPVRIRNGVNPDGTPKAVAQ
jgi:pimeloyl-ACP methyl ester carboxylesterase